MMHRKTYRYIHIDSLTISEYWTYSSQIKTRNQPTPNFLGGFNPLGVHQIIHFRQGFSIVNHPFGGTTMTMERNLHKRILHSPPFRPRQGQVQQPYLRDQLFGEVLKKGSPKPYKLVPQCVS